MAAIMRSKPKGTLIVIGGHEDKGDDSDILGRFVEVAGGRNSKLVLMTCASDKPEKKAAEYEVCFTKLGCGRVKSIHAADCQKNNLEEVLAELRQADGVFFVGGQPYRITDAIKDTPVHELLKSRYQEGLILAGTSARRTNDAGCFHYGWRVTDPSQHRYHQGGTWDELSARGPAGCALHRAGPVRAYAVSPGEVP
jgi:cyanophycinase-like exopeptidase